METIKKIYKIGYGPSSSHTMGPQKAANIFLTKNQNADHFIVYLYGSLALTGKGHLTDYIIKKTLGENKTEVIFEYNTFLEKHSNALKFIAYDKSNTILDSYLVYSVGGGDIIDDKFWDKPSDLEKKVYEHKTMEEILNYTTINKISLYDYVLAREDKDILDYLKTVLETMFLSVEEGLKQKGVLPGKLKVKRRANEVYNKYLENNDFDTLLFASALATSEMNASGGLIVTSPTCGSAGVIAGILYTLYKTNKFTKKELIDSLLIGGLIGNLIKTNASISGASVGCQGEIGSAVSMASAMLTYLYKGSNNKIEYAAEIGLEHYLGMTCDPVLGYVQIPCIERNAISARKAIDCSKYAILSDGTHYITLDKVIDTMNKTGRDLHEKYKETSLGGLASE